MAATIDVFELTNQALRDLDSKEPKKKVSESVKKTSKVRRNRKVMENKRRLNKINCSKLKLESVKFMEEADEADFDYTPDDDVVLVIDTEMEEVPETEEDAKAAAEELVGQTICKCSVCGANYVCDCENTIEEDVDGETTMVAEEDVCPVCGEEAPQIVVGEIVSDVDTGAPVETDDKVDVDVDVDVDDDGEDEDFDFDDEDFEEACSTKSTKKDEKSAKKDDEPEEDAKESMQGNRRTMRRPIRQENRKPAPRRPMHRPSRVAENRKPAMRRPMNRPAPRQMAENRKSRAYNFNEIALNRLFTKFATENYSNVKSVRFNKAGLNRGKLTIEGIVTTTKGTKRTIKLVSENFRPTMRENFKMQVREIGPFTENAMRARNRVPFVVECAVKNRVITPVSLKYSYNTTNSGLKENKGRKTTYKVYGKV